MRVILSYVVPADLTRMLKGVRRRRDVYFVTRGLMRGSNGREGSGEVLERLLEGKGIEVL